MGRQLLSFQNQENLVKSFFEVVISLCTGKFITLKKFELLVKIKNTQIFGVTWLFWRRPNFCHIFASDLSSDEIRFERTLTRGCGHPLSIHSGSVKLTSGENLVLRFIPGTYNE